MTSSGSPWLEGFIAIQPIETGTTPDTTRQAAGGWRRVWCVLQDSAISFFGHERAALDGIAEPIETFEWLHLRAISLRQIAPNTAPVTAPDTASGAAPNTAPGTAAREHGCSFEIQLSAGRSIAMRVETPAQRALWVRIIADDL